MPDNDENYKAYLAKQQENALEAASTLGFYKRHPELPPPDKDYRKYLEAVIKKQTDPYNKQPVSIDKMPVVNKQIDPNFSSPEYLESPSIHPVEASRTNRQMTNYQNKGKQMDPRLAQQLLDMHQSGQLVLHPDNVNRLQGMVNPPSNVPSAPVNESNDDFYNRVEKENAQIRDIQQGMLEANKAPVQNQLNSVPSQNQEMFDKYPNMSKQLEFEKMFHQSLMDRKPTRSR